MMIRTGQENISAKRQKVQWYQFYLKKEKKPQNNQKEDWSVSTLIPIILSLNSVLSKGQKKNKGKQLYYHMVTIF